MKFSIDTPWYFPSTWQVIHTWVRELLVDDDPNLPRDLVLMVDLVSIHASGGGSRYTTPMTIGIHEAVVPLAVAEERFKVGSVHTNIFLPHEGFAFEVIDERPHTNSGPADGDLAYPARQPRSLFNASVLRDGVAAGEG